MISGDTNPVDFRAGRLSTLSGREPVDCGPPERRSKRDSITSTRFPEL